VDVTVEVLAPIVIVKRGVVVALFFKVLVVGPIGVILLDDVVPLAGENFAGLEPLLIQREEVPERPGTGLLLHFDTRLFLRPDMLRAR